MRSFAVLLVLLVAVACSDKPVRQAPSSSPSGTSSPTTTAATGPTGSPTTKEPSKLSGAIRENVVRGASVDGASLEARAFVTTIVPDDGVRLALRFVFDRPLEKTDPRRQATIASAEVFSELRFEIAGPKGKTTFVTDERIGQSELSMAWFDTTLSIDGNGVTIPQGTARWTKPDPSLFAEPGKYTIEISGRLSMSDRKLDVKLPPLPVTVVAAGATTKSQAELAVEAASLVRDREALSKAPTSRVQVIDDVDGNLWFRFQVDAHDAGRAEGAYEVRVIEVLLDRAGAVQNYDVFLHFTCVAEGVLVDTPEGPRPVESLRPGDVVRAYDVERRAATTAVVEENHALHAERLVKLGDLWVSPGHPVFADGRFVAAGDVARGAQMLAVDLLPVPVEPRPTDRAATVFELSVSAPHTYFAGGLLVHNKAAHVPVGGNARPWRGWFYRRAART